MQLILVSSNTAKPHGHRLKSNIFNFFDVFPRRRRWPEDEKYILYF